MARRSAHPALAKRFLGPAASAGIARRPHALRHLKLRWRAAGDIAADFRMKMTCLSGRSP
jgi:hypothetical protein